MGQYDIIDDIKQQEAGFKAKVPNHAWSRIESSLEDSKTKRQISFYKLFYNAAVILLAVGIVSLISYFIVTKNSPETEANYAHNIQALSVSNNSYPVYNVHQLQKAYLRLQSGNHTVTQGLN